LGVGKVASVLDEWAVIVDRNCSDVWGFDANAADAARMVVSLA
jgi:hypothetical protein